MALVTVTIDGQTVQAPAGTSVLDAAQSIGIEIPALCYDPDLSPVGACRLCVVEIDGVRNLPASCVTRLAPRDGGAHQHAGGPGSTQGPAGASDCQPPA